MMKEEADDGWLCNAEAAGARDEPTVVMRKRALSRPVATVTLTVLDGRDRGQVIELKRGDNLIGRGQGVDVLLHDSGVSRQHALLSVGVSGKIELLDLGSTNGTFLNGERVTIESLREGDWIRLGLQAVVEIGHMPTGHVLDEDDPDSLQLVSTALLPLDLLHTASSGCATAPVEPEDAAGDDLEPKH